MYAYVMGWHKDDDDYFMEHVTTQRAQLQLAMFAIHLSLGNNVFCKRIRLGTIKDYIFTVAQVTASFREVDVRKDNQLSKEMGSFLKAVYDEIKRYEDEPNRREPHTPSMLKWAVDRAKHAPRGSLEWVLARWYLLALYAGLRCGEYAQTESHRKKPGQELPNDRGDTRAFTLDDFSASTGQGAPLSGADMLEVPWQSLKSFWTRFRTQKNGHNNVKRLFRPTPSDMNKANIMQAQYELVEWFVEQRGPNDKTTPLSIYRDDHGNIRLLTGDDITEDMRKVAAAVYNLNPSKKKDMEMLKLWSAHSLRVGACVFLHAAGFSSMDIKWILRWESDAYMAYLRNFAGLSDRQARAYALAQHDEEGPPMPLGDMNFMSTIDIYY
jgi:hypothetical protein